MANLSLANVQLLQTACKTFEQGIEQEIVKGQSAITGPDLTALQTVLNTFKTSLSNIGFTIS